MNRTKYSWALVECDSVSTAAWLYDQMDGLEADGPVLKGGGRIEGSSNRWDWKSD